MAGGEECRTSRAGLRHRGFSWQAPSPWHVVCLKGRARKGRVGCAQRGGETWGQSAHDVARGPWRSTAWLGSGPACAPRPPPGSQPRTQCHPARCALALGGSAADGRRDCGWPRAAQVGLPEAGPLSVTTILGTPAYRAPETRSGRQPGPARAASSAPSPARPRTATGTRTSTGTPRVRAQCGTARCGGGRAGRVPVRAQGGGGRMQARPERAGEVQGGGRGCGAARPARCLPRALARPRRSSGWGVFSAVVAWFSSHPLG